MYSRMRVVFLGLIPLLSLFSALPPGIQDSVTSLKVAAVQFRSTPSLEENLKRISEMLVRLAAENVRVAVFPEGALTSYTREAALAAKQGCGRGAVPRGVPPEQHRGDRRERVQGERADLQHRRGD